MFSNILVCLFVPKNNKTSIYTVFALAEKFDSNIVLLKCFHKDLPTFTLFHTKSEMKKQNELAKETQLAFDEVKEMAKLYNISVKTKSIFTESLSAHVTGYIQKNN